MKTGKNDIGSRIREVRLHLGLHQKDFGDLLGVGKQAVSHYETGASYPNPEALALIAKIGNVTLDWLITGSHPSTHRDTVIENQIREPSDGWTNPGETISPTEKRIIGMLRRLSAESRQMHMEMITTDYFNQTEEQLSHNRHSP